MAVFIYLIFLPHLLPHTKKEEIYIRSNNITKSQMYKEKQKSNNDGSRRNRMISVEHSTYSYVSWYLSNRI